MFHKPNEATTKFLELLRGLAQKGDHAVFEKCTYGTHEYTFQALLWQALRNEDDKE